MLQTSKNESKELLRAAWKGRICGRILVSCIFVQQGLSCIAEEPPLRFHSKLLLAPSEMDRSNCHEFPGAADLLLRSPDLERDSLDVWVNDHRLHTVKGLSGDPALASDSRSFAWAGLSDAGNIMLWNDAVIPTASPAYPVAISGDGRHVAYGEWRDSKVVVRCLPGDCSVGPFDDVKFLRLDAAGDHVRFAGRRGNEWFICGADSEAGPYQNVEQLRVSRTGDAFAALVSKSDGGRVVTEKGEIADSNGAFLLATPEDVRRIAWATGSAEAASVVVGKEAHGPWKGATGLSVSPGGDHWSVFVEDQVQRVLVLDGTREGGQRPVEIVRWSPGGRLPVVLYRSGTRYEITRGKEDPAIRADVKCICFSPSGDSWAYCYRNEHGTWSVWWDGISGGEFKRVHALAFPDEGTLRLAYSTETGYFASEVSRPK